MPRVPRYEERQVARQPLPTPNVPTDVPRGAGGVTPDININRAVSALDEAYTREINRFNQSSIRAAEARMAELETRILYDKDKGVSTLKGRNALSARGLLEEEWKKGVGDIEKELTNTAQKEAFRNSAAVRYASMSRTTSAHIAKEMDEYEMESALAVVENERNAAIAAAVPGAKFEQVADRAGLAVAVARAALADVADNRGLSDEARASLLAQHTSKIHALVIGRMVDNEDDIEAKKYFETVKDMLVGQDLVLTEKALEEGSTRAESQRLSDEILQKEQDPAKRLEAVRKMSKGKLRDATEERVRQGIRDDEAVRRIQQEKAYIQATNIVDANPDRPPREVVPASLWQGFTPSEREALERRSGNQDNDDKTWLDFLDLSYQAVAALNRQEFETRYWSKFDKVTRSKAEAQWNASRNAAETGKLQAKMAADVTFKQQLDDTMRSLKLLPRDKPPQDAPFSQFSFYVDVRNEAVRRKELLELDKKRPLTSVEIQEVLDGVLSQRMFLRNRMGADRDMRIPADIAHDDKRRAYVPWNTIPVVKRNEIQEELKRRGKLISRAKIEHLYAAQLLNDPALARKIMDEF